MLLPPINGLNCWFNIADPDVFRSTILVMLQNSLLRIQLARDTKPDGSEPIRGRDEIQPLLMPGSRQVKFNAIGGIGLLCC